MQLGHLKDVATQVVNIASQGSKLSTDILQHGVY